MRGSVALEIYWVTYMFLTAAYAQREEMSKALAAKSQLLKYQSELTIARIKANRISDNPSIGSGRRRTSSRAFAKREYRSISPMYSKSGQRALKGVKANS